MNYPDFIVYSFMETSIGMKTINNLIFIYIHEFGKLQISTSCEKLHICEEMTVSSAALSYFMIYSTTRTDTYMY